MSMRGKFFAATYDRFMKKSEKAGLTALRRDLLAQAAGRVLEIGGGTGANLAHYGPAVESLTITEPEAPMLRRLERKARAEAPATLVLRAPAEDLPFEDHTLRHGGIDTGPMRSGRPAPRPTRDPPGAAPGGQLAFPRTSTVHRRQDGQEAGPHERYQPVRGVLRLQPANPRHDERGRLHCDLHAAHQHAESAELRAPRHCRDR